MLPAMRWPKAMPLLLVLLLPLLASCGGGERGLRYSGTVEFPDVEVGSLVGGRVEHVLVQEGDEAQAEQVLVELDPQEWQGNLDEATALAETTQRELELLQAGTRKEDVARAEAETTRRKLLYEVVKQGARPEEIAAAEQDVKRTEAKLTEATKEVDRLKGLVRRQVEPAASLDPAVRALDTAQAENEAARQHLLLLQHGNRPEEVEAARQAWVAADEHRKALVAGPRPEEIAAKKATLEAARARIRVAQTHLKELTIKAPGACFVQTLDLRAGDLLKAGAPVAVLLLEQEPWIVVYVPEGDLAKVHLGQPARVVPDGADPLSGEVRWISRRAEYTPRNVQTREERVTQVFAVKVVITGDAGALKDGMWADVTLE